MRSEIRELHQRLGTTTIYVTHDQIEAMTMADRIVVMRDGHIAQVGAPLELYDRPANVFVAGFIGSPAMNLLPGSVSRGAGGVQVALAGAALPAPDRAGLDEGRKVVFGIRPEDMDLTDAGGIPARVVVVEPTGSETHVVLRLGDRDLTAVFRERHAFTPGQEVHLRPRPDLIHLFDGATGERLA
jgi:multiple sugar transport system ATP-binding protein